MLSRGQFLKFSLSPTKMLVFPAIKNVSFVLFWETFWDNCRFTFSFKNAYREILGPFTQGFLMMTSRKLWCSPPPPRPQDSDSHMVQMQHVFITEGPLGLPFMDTHTLLHLGPDSPTLPSPSAILSFPSRSRSSVTTVYVTFPQCRSLEICLSWCVCPKSVPLHCWVVFMWGGLFNLWAIKGHPGSPSAGPVWTKLLGTSRNRFLFSFF